jgi:hypothetical protein
MFISSHLKRIASFIVLATNLHDIPDIMKRFVSFLKEETADDFETTLFDERGDILSNAVKKSSKNLPLTLKDPALKKFKEIMAPYPSILSAGTLPKSSTVNFLYILGQFLTVITLILESKFEKEPWLKDLFKIWGSRERMNARSLVDEYSDKNTSTVKKNLIEKLNDSLFQLTSGLSH